ncbi:MAG: hypothetical protein WA659_00950 [Candidatus Aquirickettsiella sp.]
MPTPNSNSNNLLSDVLSALKNAKILNIDEVKSYLYSDPFLKALLALTNAKLLTQANFDDFKTGWTPGNLFSDALLALESAKRLTQANFDDIKTHLSTQNLFTASVWVLGNAKLLTQTNFDSIKASMEHSNFSDALLALEEAKLLTQTNFDVIKTHPNPEFFNQALATLRFTTCLTQTVFNKLKVYPNSNFIHVLSAIEKAHLRIPDNFNRLLDLDPNSNYLFSDGMKDTGWARIPSHLLTQTVFNQLIEFSQQLNSEQLILRYVNQLINIPAAGINNAQSTHTASIHASISVSATKLKNRYAKKLSSIGLEEIVTKIKNDVLDLPDSLINEAAKNCITRIITIDDFTDPKSGISIKELLALSYLARNDIENRFGSLADADKQFIEGLYEIQRGYNLSEENRDDGKVDKPICTAGTFNKLLEKLFGIHPDIELRFITKETAARKFPIIVQEEVKNYLQPLSKPETRKDFYSFIKLIEPILTEGLDIIWDEIKFPVTIRLFDEFSTLYPDREKSAGFKDLIDSGKYVELGKNLLNYQPSVLSSSGYREYCSQMLQNSSRFFSLDKTKDNLSAHRHDNPAAQREYDQRFALTLRK